MYKAAPTSEKPVGTVLGLPQGPLINCVLGPLFLSLLLFLFPSPYPHLYTHSLTALNIVRSLGTKVAEYW